MHDDNPMLSLKKDLIESEAQLRALNENIANGMIGEDIELSWLPEADLWPVKIDPTQINQILANLCTNAHDAMANSGTITIETGKRYCDSHICLNSGVEPGDYVFLTISDNGCGMGKDIMSHLFEPFFTTKDVGKGTGMGLSMIYGIVKQNNGFINVYSEPDIGSSFMIYLPRFEKKTFIIKAEYA